MRDRNPNAGKFRLPPGYKDLGWQVDTSNPRRAQCKENGHSIATGEVGEIDNSLYLNRGTDIIRICHVCKIVDHTDMSD